MDKVIHFFGERTVFANSMATLVVLAGLLVARWATIRSLRNSPSIQPEARRRWMVLSRDIALLLFAFLAAIIWAAEIRTAALSIVAFAVAIVIATKELILCVLGSVVRGSSSSFSLGDRVEIGHLRGDVIDMTLLTTTILEVGPGQASHQKTGRAVTLPNSLFLSSPVINESFTEQYVLHMFVVPVSVNANWTKAEAIILEAANVVCEPYLELARKHFNALRDEHSLDAPNPDPRVTLQLAEPDQINLLVRIPAPAPAKGRTEQAILRALLTRLPDWHNTVETSVDPESLSKASE